MIGHGLLVAVVVGLALRLTVRDRFPYLATLYYALPLPVLAALGSAAAVLLRKRRLFRVALAAAIASTLWTATTLIADRGGSVPADACRVVFWNVARGAGGWEAIANELNACDADLIALVESGRPDEMRPFWTSRFPGHRAATLRGGMALLVRGDVLDRSFTFLDDGGAANRVVVRLRGVEWVVWIVDIHSDPLMPRGPAYHALADAVGQDLSARPDRPTLVMGDFNTPSDSAHAGRFGGRLRNAFAAAGTGYAATWPMPAPVLTLDQAWVGGPVPLVRCAHAWTRRSDHRRVELLLDMPGDVSATP